jgi:hypothetical protein
MAGNSAFVSRASREVQAHARLRRFNGIANLFDELLMQTLELLELLWFWYGHTYAGSSSFSNGWTITNTRSWIRPDRAEAHSTELPVPIQGERAAE